MLQFPTSPVFILKLPVSHPTNGLKDLGLWRAYLPRLEDIPPRATSEYCCSLFVPGPDNVDELHLVCNSSFIIRLEIVIFSPKDLVYENGERDMQEMSFSSFRQAASEPLQIVPACHNIWAKAEGRNGKLLVSVNVYL